MGKDKAKTFAAAKKLNALLVPGNDLVANVLTPGETVADAIKMFRTDDIPGRKWAPKTAEVYESVRPTHRGRPGVNAGGGGNGESLCDLHPRGDRAGACSQQFRLVLAWILACAVEEGWTLSDHNEKGPAQ